MAPRRTALGLVLLSAATGVLGAGVDVSIVGNGGWIPTNAAARGFMRLPVFNPEPVKAWLPALRNLSLIDSKWSVVAPLNGRSSPEALAAFSPLIQALEATSEGRALRGDIERAEDLRGKDRRRIAEQLDAVLRAAALEAEGAAGGYWESEAQKEDPQDAQAMRHRITEFEAAASHFSRLKALYGGEELAQLEDQARLRAKALREAWLATELDKETQMLKAFIDDFHRELIAQSPELFHHKMRKAIVSDFTFLRAFPQFQYLLLRKGPYAARLDRTVVVRLAGDFHVDNVELVPFKGSLVAQMNDFDDSALGPVGLDITRGLAGIALLGSGDAAARRALIEEARQAYAAGLKLKFKDWAESLAEEKSVSLAKPLDRDWPHQAGRRVERKLERSLLKETGLEELKEDDWKGFDRRGAGLSSIGVLRYLFLSFKRKHVWELKQLRAAAVEYFTGPSSETHAERLAKAYSLFRRVVVEVRTLIFNGMEWLLRRREAAETRLNLDHPKSAARVMGGLLAQMHKHQADLASLNQALETVSVELALDSAQAMARMRQKLIDLLNRGTWEKP